MRKILLVLLLASAGCGGADWSLHKAPFFDITIPPGFALTEKNDNLLRFETDTAKITLAWTMDQHSMKDYPAREVVTGNPGDSILVSEPQQLGKCKVWYSEIESRDKRKHYVYMTIPLDKGELRVEAVSNNGIADIRTSVRSVAVTNEIYFSYPR